MINIARRFLRTVAGAATILERRLPTAVTLNGDRTVEWSWVAAHLPDTPGRVLDFGAGNSWLSLTAAMKGSHVVAVDLREPRWYFSDDRVELIRGDVLEMDLAERSFDCIMNCSSIEHVGISGRYGVERDEQDGDLRVMELFRRLLKPDGVHILTIPVGRDAVFAPLHRIYGTERLPRLLAGWRVESDQYWVKQSDNRWTRTDKAVALARRPKRDLYGLGCMTLRLA